MFKKYLFGFLCWILSLSQIDSYTIWRLECGVASSPQCKNQLGELMMKVMQIECLHLAQEVCSHLTNLLHDAQYKYTEAEKAASQALIENLETLKREASAKRNDKDELENVLNNKILPLIKENQLISNELQEHPDVQDLMEKAPRIAYERVWENILRLFEGLRPEDYEIYPELEVFKSFIKDFKSLDFNELSLEQFKERANPILEFFNYERADFEMF